MNLQDSLKEMQQKAERLEQAIQNGKDFAHMVESPGWRLLQLQTALMEDQFRAAALDADLEDPKFRALQARLKERRAIINDIKRSIERGKTAEKELTRISPIIEGAERARGRMNA